MYALLDLPVNGPKIYLQITALKDKFMGLLANPITQTTVSLFAVSIILIIIAIIISKNLKKRPGRFQVIVEKLVTSGVGVYELTFKQMTLEEYYFNCTGGNE